MHWILQDNIYSEEGFEALVSNLERLSISYSIHKVVPFIGELDPDPELPYGSNVIVMGSYSLARHAVKRGWRPGAFLGNLDFETQHKHWGDRMFNHDAKIYPFAQVPFQEQPFFIRPAEDSKAFTGYVSDWADYTKWRDSLIRLPETADPVNDPLGINLLTVHTPVMVCSKKEVYSETRTWIVNDSPGRERDRGLVMRLGHRPVTWSGYKVGTIKRYTPPEMVDDRIVKFAHECASIWAPNDAFVLDVADTPNGLKIMEVNNLNSAGFYKGDMQKLILALESMGGLGCR
jgi:hypothetical protein